MIGTALVLVVGGLHVIRGELTVGELLVVITYLGAVYGPLSSIAHTTGDCRRAGRRASRARDLLAHRTLDAPDAIDAQRSPARSASRMWARLRDGTDVLHDISFTARRARWSRSSA